MIQIRAVVLIFLPGIAACRSGTPESGRSARRADADSIAIAELHAKDMKAVAAGDTTTLMSLWSDDIVSLAPRGPIRRGRELNAALLRENMRASLDAEPIDYKLRFDETVIRGDLAVEWGSYSAKVRMRSSGATAESRGKLMRMLRRQPYGSWKVWRTIYTENAPAEMPRRPASPTRR